FFSRNGREESNGSQCVGNITSEQEYGFNSIKKSATTQTISHNLSKKNIYDITAQGIGKIFFVPVLGDNEYVTLTADKDIIDDFAITFDENRLFVGPKQNSTIKNAQEITYKVSLKFITHVELSGTVEAYFDTKRKENE